MPRLPRYDDPGTRHHVMNRAARRETIFRNHRDRAVFHGLIAELPQRENVRVHAWAIMPNHFHLLLTAGNRGLGPALKRLQSGYATYLNSVHAWDGPVWRARFKSRPVSDDDYWRHLLAYVHANPVRSGHCQQVGQLDWTSHRHYAYSASPPDWLTTDEHQELFGSPAAYREYLAEWLGGVDVSPMGFDADALWKRGPRTLPDAGAARRRDVLSGMDEDQAWAAFELVVKRDREAVVRHEASISEQHVALWWLTKATGTPATTVGSLMSTKKGKAQYAVRRVESAVDAPICEWRERLLALL